MQLPFKHLLETNQFNPEVLRFLFEESRNMEGIFEKGGNQIMKGKILATLFWEPSTRTRFSFETAMLKLGGQVISNFSMGQSSSITKGETLEDTARTISCFVDIIAMRHHQQGAVAEFTKGSSAPVINAGDGAGDHPTQGLLDIYTIWKWRKFENFEKAFGNLTIGMIGDLKNSRVVHAQLQLLKFFKPKFILVSPNALRMPEVYLNMLKDYDCEYEETEDLESVISDFDVLSDTRIQQERFENREEFEKYRTFYQIGNKIMKKAKKDMIVIAPLPRFGELLPEFDSDPRAKYFEQVKNGVALRMGLIKGMC